MTGVTGEEGGQRAQCGVLVAPGREPVAEPAAGIGAGRAQHDELGAEHHARIADVPAVAAADEFRYPEHESVERHAAGGTGAAATAAGAGAAATSSADAWKLSASTA